MYGQGDPRRFGGRGPFPSPIRSFQGRGHFGYRFEGRGSPVFQRGRGFQSNMRGSGPEPPGNLPPRGFPIGHRPPNSFPNNVLWAETRLPNGKSYFYHTITRETTWERPEGPNVRIISHNEWCTIKKRNAPARDLGNSKSPAEENSNREEQGPPIVNTDNSPVSGSTPLPWNASPPEWQMMEKQINPVDPNMPGQNQGPRFTEEIYNDSNHMNPPPPFPVRPNNVAPNNSAPPFHPPVQSRPLCPEIPPGNNIPNPPFDQATEQPGKGDFGSSMQPALSNASLPMTPGHGCPTFPPPMMPLQFGLPPPFLSPFNVRPPFTDVTYCPIPFGVPPPTTPNMNEVVSQMDPKMLSQVNEWSEFKTQDGKSYFFNATANISVWEKPQILKEFDAARDIVLQRVNVQHLRKDNIDKELVSNPEVKDKAKEEKKEKERKKNKAREMCKPISCTPISGTPWCIVWTGDKRVFFYNPSNKKSLWERPLELIGQSGIDEMMKAAPDGKSSKVKKAEATSTTEPISESKIKIAPIKSIKKISRKCEKGSEKSTELNSKDVKRSLPETAEDLTVKRVKKSKEESQETASSEESKDTSDEKIELVDLGSSGDVTKDEETLNNTGDGKSSIETKDALKEANALEAEVKAAGERARIPLEERLEQFRQMLVEKNVSAFSAWEKELHKIVFDPRYLLLASKERRAAFENYVKDRAEEEKLETVKKIKRAKEIFVEFLGQVNVGLRMSYLEFSQKYCRHELYKVVENSRDRESCFNNYVSELKRKDKLERTQKKEKATEEFLQVLKTDVKDYLLSWSDVKKKFDSKKYDALDEEEQQKLFRNFLHDLKCRVRLSQKKQEMDEAEIEIRLELKKQGQEKDRDKSRPDKKESAPVKTKFDKKEDKKDDVPVKCSDIKEKDILVGITDTKIKFKLAKDETKRLKQSGDKFLEISEQISEEEEEGCLVESDDESRLKKEKKVRTEISLKKREKEVKETLAVQFRDRETERHRHEQEAAIEEFQALLNDLVKNPDASWNYVKKDIRNDRRWRSVCVLRKREIKELFVRHCDALLIKKERRFRELLHEVGVKLTSRWKDVRSRIRNDHRYRKFSSSDEKCEREFEFYLNDMKFAVKSDFWELLKETKMLTYKTKQLVRQNHHVLKDIESVLAKDKRYLEMDCMPKERDRLLIEYLDNAERQGPPPPPTASLRKKS